jgi:hypothetical protein
VGQKKIRTLAYLPKLFQTPLSNSFKLVLVTIQQKSAVSRPIQRRNRGIIAFSGAQHKKNSSEKN